MTFGSSPRKTPVGERVLCCVVLLAVPAAVRDGSAGWVSPRRGTVLARTARAGGQDPGAASTNSPLMLKGIR